jgi:hypothetical protein
VAELHEIRAHQRHHALGLEAQLVDRQVGRVFAWTSSAISSWCDIAYSQPRRLAARNASTHRIGS